ncbi:MAG TPA: M56 family metallopeptidase, partial [Eudoraea sp.]|nr:M56 family metallopeptidase [Eudoraea sp.]
MDAFPEYILKASCILLIFLLIYELFLKKDTFFEANRHYLLSGLTAAFILPLVTITKYIEVQPLAPEDAGSIQLTAALRATDHGFNWTYLIYIIYIIGLAFFCLRFLVQLLSLKGLIKEQGRKREGGYIFVETKKNIAPFSFFHYIFYNPDLYNATELEAILCHEKAHSSQWHSIDVLLAHLACTFLWMNPLAWWYKKSIKQNLEFLADAIAAREISSIRAYQYTMLRVSGISLCTHITNTFYNSLIKKRIVMLHKSKSGTNKLLKFFLVIPLLILFVFVFNVETKASTTPDGEPNALPGQEMSTSDKKAYLVTKEMTDEEIASLGRKIKNEGGDLLVKKVKRNGAGIITSIKITYKSEHGE